MHTATVAKEVLLVKNNFARTFKRVNTKTTSDGFTLIELLVAMSLTLIVTSLAGFGLVAIMTNNNKAEAKTQRRIEINRALAFISDEVRMARKINPTNTTNNTTTTAGNAVVASAAIEVFSPPLGLVMVGGADTSITSITNVPAVNKQVVLYLEIPLTPITTPNCPAGGPNANSPPPVPSTHDRVVYYIRPDSSNEWLGPRVIKRYGRTPTIDGTINPCSTPELETFIDSISDSDINPVTTSNPPCPATPAVRSGKEGFYVCVNGRDVSLYLRSKVASTQFPAEPPENVSTKAFSRISPPP